jgi:6-phosphogluconate dehydrogenase
MVKSKDNIPKMALIGMGVMGANVAKNFAEKGYDIAIYNRTESKTKRVYDESENEPFFDKLHPVYGDLKNLVKLVGKKGIYFLMVNAGYATITVTNNLLKLLSPGAIIVDLANSNYHETIKLQKIVTDKNIHFFGVGVSGGEVGARVGPSIMPGGSNRKIYNQFLKKPFEKISGKAPQDNKPCVTYCGNHGAGHFVKMVHNGIEYADMQLIAESYELMRRIGLTNLQASLVFEKYNQGRLKSYLIEITSEVLVQKDPNNKGQLIDYILDKAKMKGTGTWTVMSSLEIESGVVPIPSIYAAVESRAISFVKDKRMKMSQFFSFKKPAFKGNKNKVLKDLENALYLGKIAAYAQGIDLIQKGDKEYNFGGIKIGKIAEIWRAGCIIRAQFLNEITKAYDQDNKLISLMASSVFKNEIKTNFDSLNRICKLAIDLNLPFMAYDTSRSYIIQSFSKKLSANLIQGLRDYFGSHTYERIDKKGLFHTNWSTDKKEIKNN